ncbi:PREDICTED: gag-asp_proteas domain-containing, partial [Prunus dulcis]
CFLCQGAHHVKDCLRWQNLNAIVTENEGGAKEGSNLQVSRMVLLNSLRVIPPEDPLGEDTIVQP